MSVWTKHNVLKHTLYCARYVRGAEWIWCFRQKLANFSSCFLSTLSTNPPKYITRYLSVKPTIVMNCRSTYRQLLAKHTWRKLFPRYRPFLLKWKKNLILTLGSTKHQLVNYSLAQSDVIEYDTGARGANKFIQLNKNASLFFKTTSI